MFTIDVKENEKALLYKDEKFIELYGVGRHKLFTWFQNYGVERVKLDAFGLTTQKSKTLLKTFPEKANALFQVVELTEDEMAYVWIDGNFVEILEAGTVKLYFKEYTLKVEKVNVKEQMRVDEKHIKYLDRVGHLSTIKKYIIDKNALGYLFVDEKYVELLLTGKHYFYTNAYDVDVKAIDTRIKELEITGQELLSLDKVTLRCNATMHYGVEDGLKYLTAVESPKEYIYKQLQFAIREHMGRLNVDEILTKQHALNEEIVERFKALCLAVGVKVEAVHIKDIILPGEMREIFNQVIEATKRAEATNIQRREETAATRSLLNTAKLMKDNPALARLKELEALEKITPMIDTLNVYGGLENVMHGLVDLRGEK
jgi:regulator of protease activity HflC (stomatin/prohibitin superfamily)